jgi:uncharacterized RDD family membrane protein YckC
MPGRLGVYYALMDESPSKYEFIDKQAAIKGFLGKDGDIANFDLYDNELLAHPELMEPFKNQTFYWDIKISSIFLLVNFLYYVLSVMSSSSTPGYELMGLTIVNSERKRIREGIAIKRGMIILGLSIIAILARFQFNTNYILIIVLYFVFVDIPVFVDNERRSLIDTFSNTYVVKKQKDKR